MSFTTPDGLDLAEPDSWTESERAAFTAFYVRTKGTTLPGHDFWMDFDPPVLKGYRRQTTIMTVGAEIDHPKIGPLCWLHLYAIIGFAEGIDYQIVAAQRRGGADRQEILATLAVAFLHAGPKGIGVVARHSRKTIEESQPDGERRWPAGWSNDASVLQAGLDYTDPTLAGDEADLLRDWYREKVGYVPDHIEHLLTYSPDILKAHRYRYETSLRGCLPVQMLPLLQLQWELYRGNVAGIRETAALARALGVDRSFVIGCLNRSLSYSGPAGVASAFEALAPLLEVWTDEVET